MNREVNHQAPVKRWNTDGLSFMQSCKDSAAAKLLRYRRPPRSHGANMKTLGSALIPVLLSIAACGGQANDDGRPTNARTADSDDAGADDDSNADDDDNSDDADDDNSDDADDDDNSDDADDDDDDGISDDDNDADDGDGISDDDMVPVPVDPIMPTTPIATGAPVSPPVSRPPIGVPAGPSDGQPPPPLENCEPEYVSDGPGYCETQFSCDGDYLYSYCSQQGTDSWACECGTNYGYSSYQVAASAGLNACDVATDVCGAAVEFSGEPVCQPQYETNSSDYCELGYECTQSAAISDGITATRRTYQNTYCYASENMSMYCDCNVDGAYRSYELAGVTGSESCSQAFDLCLNGEPADFGDEEECIRENQSEGAGSCSIGISCSKTVDIGDGVTARELNQQWISCQTSGDTSVCSCEGSNRYFRFQADEAVSGLPTCEGAIDICRSDDPVEPSGPIECVRSRRSAGQNYCDTSYDCTQSADIAGSTVSVYGGLYASCQELSDGSWTCYCSSDIDSAELTVEADEGFDACEAAGTQCQDLVDIQIGGYGYGVGQPGIPIPGRPIPL